MHKTSETNDTFDAMKIHVEIHLKNPNTKRSDFSFQAIFLLWTRGDWEPVKIYARSQTFRRPRGLPRFRNKMASAAAQIKNWLYAFCGKKKTQPIYSQKPSQPGKFAFQVSKCCVFT